MTVSCCVGVHSRPQHGLALGDPASAILLLWVAVAQLLDGNYRHVGKDSGA
jgi:hypothetical protein